MLRKHRRRGGFLKFISLKNKHFKREPSLVIRHERTKQTIEGKRNNKLFAGPVGRRHVAFCGKKFVKKNQ